MSDMKNPNEQREIAKRLSHGLSHGDSGLYLPATTQLTKAWCDTAASPLPDKISNLLQALEAKLGSTQTAQ